MHPSQDTNVDMNNDNENLSPLFIPRDMSSLGKTFDIVPFSKQTFSNPNDASRYLTSDAFREYWNRGSVPLSQEPAFAYRVETGESPWLGEKKPFERRNYKALFDAENAKIKLGEENTIKRAALQWEGYWNSNGRGYSSNERAGLYENNKDGFIKKELDVYRNAKARRTTSIQNASRVEGRFFTPLDDILRTQNTGMSGNSQSVARDPLAWYLDASQHAQSMDRAGPYSRPISMIAGENLPAYRMAGNPFGLKDFPEFDHVERFDDITSGRSSEMLKKKYGLKLGTAVSTNPSQEYFIPKTLAANSRRVGKVVDLPSGNAEIQVWGPPNVSPRMQLLNNVARNAPKAAMGGLLVADAIQNGPAHALVTAVAGPILDLNAGENEYLSQRGMTRFDSGDPTAKKLEEDRDAYLKQQAEERKLRKEASDVMLKTKAVEENISKSPFWTTFK